MAGLKNCLDSSKRLVLASENFSIHQKLKLSDHNSTIQVVQSSSKLKTSQVSEDTWLQKVNTKQGTQKAEYNQRELFKEDIPLKDFVYMYV